MSEKRDDRGEKLITATRKGDLQGVLVSFDYTTFHVVSYKHNVLFVMSCTDFSEIHTSCTVLCEVSFDV